jgi:hypothetical protein
MELNLPIFDQLTACQNLLIAGMGGDLTFFVAEHNLFLSQLRDTNTFMEALQIYLLARQGIPGRAKAKIPLS